MKSILEEIENQLAVNNNALRDVRSILSEETEIDWPDDSAEEMIGLNQEINYRLKRFHSNRYEDPKKLKKDIQTRYPYSAMWEGYGSCMVEVKPDGNICYDFIGMISTSADNLDCWHCFRSDFNCFSQLDGLKELCDYLYTVHDTEGKIEPILLMDGCEIYWTDFIYTDYNSPDFEDEQYYLHLAIEKLGTCERDWELDFFPSEDNTESNKLEWQD